MRLLLAIVLLLFQGSCASKLQRELTRKAPQGAALETILDLDTIFFRKIDDGSTLNLGVYLRTFQLKYALLVFGSKGCAICNREAYQLQNDLIGKHKLFLTENGKAFQVIGVNTDRDLDQRLKAYTKPLPFIAWNDPSGQAMLTHFMPKGRRFAVPLMVLVKVGGREKSGVVWRILPDEAKEVSLADLALKLEKSLDSTLDPNQPQKPVPTHQPPPPPSSPLPPNPETQPENEGPFYAQSLADPRSDRLRYVEVADCEKKNPTELKKLQEGSDLFLVQVMQKSCDQNCRDLTLTLKKECGSLLPEGRCRLVRLFSQELPSDCKRGQDYLGGQAFFDVFATHFNWEYTPIEKPDYSLTLPEVKGPLVFGFDTKGGLILSAEKNLSIAKLKAALDKQNPEISARGPDFSFYDRNLGVTTFSQFRFKSRYTIVNAFSTLCSSCIEELKHWSAPGHLAQYCAQRPKDCQLIGIERSDAVSSPDDLPAVYDQVQDLLRSESILVPFLLDPVSQEEPLKRFFDGYVSALMPDWGGLYGSLIYDREGKVVASFVSSVEGEGSHELVFRKVKNLLNASIAEKGSLP